MNIYVSNIPFKMTDDQLGELFAVHGEVISAKIIMDKFTKRSRGFGFVEMSDEAGQAAIADLNGKEVMGLELRVNEARPRTEDSSGGGYGGGGGNRNRGGGGGGYKRDY
ncbi:MAG: RNA-binding protein [Bacteroidetes bacterium]|jgi:RNA recognition motif-containing protein|nr:RNA-binding protein [Bacteroidota bacterium]HQW46256.1 RNA-binding protein [Chitinophagaceae bacterium]MBK7040264.1 RNA-binding protein [Bacteroidota bacterium]MBK7586880.1 RNA-binding protein [Bacteroidota bacterium]MBK8330462.1 RNA-binding protein [Bacteroidota bacterium]